MMACENKLWFVILFLLQALINTKLCVHGAQPQVPCLFIFGDSLSDCGNNNNLKTEAKANHLPYGIDFPGGPTGRFTNGLTTVDIITQLLGFKNLIPPFANTSGSDILQGVNYASGAAGIRKDTGTHMGSDVSLEIQINNHRVIISKIAERVGGIEKAEQHLNKCLYYVNIGSNDFINNYFMPQLYPTSRTFSPDKFAMALIQEYALHLRALHETGARKFALIGLGLAGCSPHEISSHGKKWWFGCVKEENMAVLDFNVRLSSLVHRLNNELSDSKFIYVNTPLIGASPEFAGLKKSKSAGCCEVGKNGMCIANKKPCENRKSYGFWDGFHPTQTVNQIVARKTYRASNISFTYPMDIEHLAKL